MAKQFYLTITLALLLGCQGGWDKNPKLEGLPPEVEQEPPAYMNAMRDSIFVMSDLEYEFVEGQQDAVVEFDVKVLQEDIAEVQVMIPGLEDFLTGATQSYDPNSGKMTIQWDVPEVFVRGLDTDEISYDLEVKVFTRSLNNSTNGYDKPVRFTVLRKLERPEIVSVELISGDKGTPELKENSSISLRAIVRDPNSSNGRLTVAPPVLMVEPTGTTSLKSGHHLMTVDQPSQDANDPQLWRFTVRIVTTGLEITTSSTMFYYDLRAYTPMGMSDRKLRSTAYQGSFRVLTNIGQVEFTGGHRVNFREGGSNSVTVTFYDPRGEGKAIVNTDELNKTCRDKGAVCECKAQGDRQVCEIWWSPKATDADPRREVVHTFQFKAHLEHKYTKEKSAEKVFEQAVHVTAAF